jgi:hypothetical protein
MGLQRDRMAELERDAAAVLDSLSPEFEAGRAHTDPLEYIEVLRDTSAINRRFAELQAQVKREILVFTKPPFARPPQDNVEGIEVSRAHRAASVYEFSAIEDPGMKATIRRFIEAGTEARFVERLPLKLVIIDESIVMFGMDDPVASSDAVTIVVVEHPALALTLKLAFESTWDRGLTYEEAQRLAELPREQTA